MALSFRERNRPAPMPRATLTLRCNECRETIGEYDLGTESIAAVLFAARKEHARGPEHGWKESE